MKRCVACLQMKCDTDIEVGSLHCNECRGLAQCQVCCKLVEPERLKWAGGRIDRQCKFCNRIYCDKCGAFYMNGITRSESRCEQCGWDAEDHVRQKK